MTPAQKADAFVAQYNGQHIDEDGYYGAQCWDVVARYAREQYGCPSFPTGSGGAEGLFRIFADPIGQYFNKVANSPDPNQVPSKGDIVVWQASFSPPYGHTALVLAAGPSQLTVLEQNGNNPGGASYIKIRSWVGVSGWLTPKDKGGNMADKINSDTSKILQHGILARNGISGRTQALDGSTGEPWVGGDLTNQFISDVFLSPEGRQWRDSGEYNSISGINDRLVQGANDAAQVSDLSKRPTQQQLDDAAVAQKTAETQFTELKKVDEIKDKQITDLKAQLAIKPTDPGVPSDDTVQLNKFGEALRWLIKRLGGLK